MGEQYFVTHKLMRYIRNVILCMIVNVFLQLLKTKQYGSQTKLEQSEENHRNMSQISDKKESITIYNFSSRLWLSFAEYVS